MHHGSVVYSCLPCARACAASAASRLEQSVRCRVSSRVECGVPIEARERSSVEGAGALDTHTQRLFTGIVLSIESMNDRETISTTGRFRPDAAAALP
jgi:hypothetical protein